MYILWVACFLGEVNKIFELLGLLYFYRVKMDYYLYKNPISLKPDNFNVTNLKILSVLFSFFI